VIHIDLFLGTVTALSSDWPYPGSQKFIARLELIKLGRRIVVRTWLFTFPAKRWHMIALAVLTCGLWMTASALEKLPKADVQTLDRQGRALHQAVLDQDHKRQVAGPAGLDIGEVVGKFIPIGTPFSEANEILRAAGYTVNTVRLATTHERITWATLTLAGGFLVARVAHVQLLPEPQHDPGQPGERVAEIRASIATSAP